MAKPYTSHHPIASEIFGEELAAAIPRSVSCDVP
jgi:hypothetical protein